METIPDTSISKNSTEPRESEFSALGVHYLVEFSGCEEQLLTDKELLSKTMETAAREAGATVVGTLIHQFNPHGLSGVVVIAESHLAVHTWPERSYAAVDIFTCGNAEVAEAIFHKLLEKFSPEAQSLRVLERNPV